MAWVGFVPGASHSEVIADIGVFDIPGLGRSCAAAHIRLRVVVLSKLVVVVGFAVSTQHLVDVEFSLHVRILDGQGFRASLS